MQVTGSVLNIQEITHTFLVMKIIDFIQHMYLHWHYFIKNDSRWSVRCEKIEKWCLLKLTSRKGFVKGSHFQSCNLLNEHQWSNYIQIIWDYVLFYSPIYKYGRNGAKKKRALFKHLKKFKQFKKLISL